MDKTAQNILMCREAQPIQKLFRTSHEFTEMNSGHFITWRYKGEPEHDYVITLGDDIEYDRVRNCLFRPGIGHGSHTPEKYRVLSEYDWAWIPRLDQLLDIISDTHNFRISKLHSFCFGFNEFKGVYNVSPLFIFKSLEQIALGLVMYNNYQEVWNETKWIDFIK